MAKDYDKIAKGLGAVDYDALAQNTGGKPAVTVKGHSRRPRGSLADVPAVVMTPFGPMTLDRSAVAEALPTVLGGAGGILTKPFAAGIPGAAAGGAVGEGLAELLMGETPSLGQIGAAGASQGAYEAAGGLLSKAAVRVAGPIMQLALKSGPEVAATALREGISATKLGMGKLLKRLGVYGDQTQHIVGQATRLGQRLDVVPLLKNTYADVYPQVTPNLTGEQVQALNAAIQDFIGENPNRRITPARLHILKQRADQLAHDIYRREASALPPTVLEGARAKFYKAFADRARETLNATVGGYEKSNAPTEALIKLREALTPTAKKEMSRGAQVASAVMKPGVRAAIGAGIGSELPGDRGRNALVGAGLGAIGASPQALSGLSLFLNSPLMSLLLRQAPRAVGGAAGQR